MLAGRMTLGRRIALLVVLGLAVVLFLFGFLSLRGLQESSDRALHERLVAAQLTARHIDNFLELYLSFLDQIGQTANLDLYDQDLSSEKQLLDVCGRLSWRHGTGGVSRRPGEPARLDGASLFRQTEPVGRLPPSGSRLHGKGTGVRGSAGSARAIRGGPGGARTRGRWQPKWRFERALGPLGSAAWRVRGVGSLGQTGHAEIVDAHGTVLASSIPLGSSKRATTPTSLPR